MRISNRHGAQPDAHHVALSDHSKVPFLQSDNSRCKKASAVAYPPA
jgi:hypothetical protein